MGNLCLGPAESTRPTTHARPTCRTDLNAAVDRLQLSDLKAMQSRFSALLSAQETAVVANGRRGTEGSRSGGAHGLNFQSFQKALPKLQEVDEELQRAVFRAFNLSYVEDVVDLRDFIGTVALCRHGTRRQQLELLLRIFSFLTPAGDGASASTGSQLNGSGGGGGGGDGTTLNREQFERLKQHFNLPGNIVRDQPSLTSSTTTSSPPLSNETVPLDTFLHWADGGPPSPLPPSLLAPFFSRLAHGAIDSPARELERISATLLDAAQTYQAAAHSPSDPLTTFTNNTNGGATSSNGGAHGNGNGSCGGGGVTVVEPVFLVSASWWHAWCDYVGAGPSVRGYPPPPPPQEGGQERGAEGGKQLCRPNEVDNSDIADTREYVIKSGLQEGEHFVVLPGRTWEELWGLYGGGPAFPRQCALATSHMSQKASQGSQMSQARKVNGDTDHGLSWHDVRRGFSVDLYPVQLCVSLCYRSTLVLNECKDLPFLVSCRLTSHDELMHNLAHYFLADYDRQHPKTQARLWVMRLSRRERRSMSHSHSHSGSQSGSQGWAASGGTWDDEAENRAEAEEASKARRDASTPSPIPPSSSPPSPSPPSRIHSEATASSSTPKADPFPSPPSLSSHPPARAPSRPASQPFPSLPPSISASATCRWELLDPQRHEHSLETAAFQHTDRLLLEVKLHDEAWPRDALSERPGFRDFKTGHRVDAIDYQGKCYSGTVVEVVEEGPPPDDHDDGAATEERRDARPTSTSQPLSFSSSSSSSSPSSDNDATDARAAPLRRRRRMRVKVHFDNFAPRWDEWYEADSAKLCPVGSLTAPCATTAQRPAALRIHSLPPPHTHQRAGASTTIKLSPPKDCPRSSSLTLGMGANLFGRGGGLGGVGGIGGRSLLEGGGAMITDAGKQLLALPSSVAGVPHRPGGCGLANLGNTCFINAALQCLSHTPLLKSYFLSHQFERDINTRNVLGTQGKLAEEFASLLRALWGGDFVSVSPSKFRRTLAKYKPQFAGNEQQDSQEFLTVMLDSLHEDLNRVVDKPYVQNPEEENDEAKRKPLEALGEEAWERHLKRNQSIIVDLFQGQVKCETACAECGKRSITFDPLHFLSVPVPVANERFIKVTVIPRVRTSHLSPPLPPSPTSPPPSSPPQPHDPPGLRPTTYAMLLPRDALVSQVMAVVCEKSGIPQDRLLFADVARNRIQRTLTGREVLGAIRDDECLFAYESREPPNSRYRWGAPDPPPSAPSTTPSAPLSAPLGGSTTTPSSPRTPFQHHQQRVVQAAEASTFVLDLAPPPPPPLPPQEEEEEEESDSDMGEETLEAQRDGTGHRAMRGQAWPTRLEDVTLGTRVDAVDYRGTWYVGSVVTIETTPVLRVKVHFDRFSPKWDEWYDEAAWKAGRLVPPYSKTTRRRKVLQAQVFHRRPALGPSGLPLSLPPVPYLEHTRGLSESQASDVSSSNGPIDPPLRRRSSTDASLPPPVSALGTGMTELFGLPFFVYCDTSRSFRCLYWRVIKQALRFLSPEARVLALRLLHAHGAGLEVGGSSDLPFIVRVVNPQHPTSACGLCRAPQCNGCPLPIDHRQVISNSISNTIALVLDWADHSAYYEGLARGVLDASYREVEARQALRCGVSLGDCLQEYTREETLELESCWRCGVCRKQCRGRRREQLWKLPDVLVVHIKRFLAAGRWRDKIRTRVDFPLEGLDMSPWLCRSSASSSSHSHATTTGGSGDSKGNKQQQQQKQTPECLYDLQCVINHAGSMSGGHYTAVCRLQDLRAGLAPSAQGLWKVAPTWLSFDDESVSACQASEVVTPSAYVLLYARRTFRPSNVLNTSLADAD